MKKAFLWLLLFVFVFALSLSSTPIAKAETAVIGPSCNFAPTDYADVLFSGSPNTTIAESFTTTLDTISHATLKANSLNNFTGNITLAVYKMPEASVPTNGIVSKSFNNMDSTVQDYDFLFPGLVDVDSSSTYYLVAWINGASTGTFYWKTSGNDTCYTGGHEYINTVDSYNIDLGFAIYGFNPATEAVVTPDATPASTPGSTPASTVGLGDTPAAQTTTSIKAPTELKAENVAGAAAPTVKISWKKSVTTDITGYKIFRSTEASSGFKEIGKVDKAIVEYSDATGVASTKYYYFVRAYKDTAESASSSTVSLTTEVAPVAEATSGTGTVVASTGDTVAATETAPTESSSDWVLIAAIIALVLLAGAVTYLELKAKKDGKKVSPKLLYPLIGLAVIAAGLIIWRVMPASENTTIKTEETAVVAPKHADWPVFESVKNGFKLYYPTEYTVTEGAGGNVSINKGAEIMAEIHSYNNDGDDAGMMRASGALYMDAAKGYMTGGVESSATAAGESAKRYTGIFGKNAGAKVMVHDGITGSVVMFTKNSRTWMFHSFDNGNAAAQAIFDDMIADMRF